MDNSYQRLIVVVLFSILIPLEIFLLAPPGMLDEIQEEHLLLLRAIAIAVMAGGLVSVFRR